MALDYGVSARGVYETDLFEPLYWGIDKDLVFTVLVLVLLVDLEGITISQNIDLRGRRCHALLQPLVAEQSIQKRTVQMLAR